MSKQVVIVIHGMDSVAPTDTAKALVDGTDFLIVAPQLDYKDYIHTEAKLESIIEDCLAVGGCEDVILVGSSFGGWWAYYMARKFGVKCVLINPSLLLHEVFSRYEFSIENQVKYVRTAAEYGLSHYRPGVYVDCLLGLKDDVVPPQHVDEFFPSVKILDNEGHRIKDKQEIINMVIKASNNLSC